MKTPSMRPAGVTRRAFVRAGLGAAGAALLGARLGAAAPVPLTPEEERPGQPDAPLVPLGARR